MSTNPSPDEMPKYIEIEPTDRCNLRCRMCHVSNQKPGNTVVDTHRMVPHLHGTENAIFSIGSNFEPSMHPQFRDLVHSLSDAGAQIDLTTNGTLLSPQLANDLANCRFRRIWFSFDGIRPETYENIRRNSNHQRTLERILHFRKTVAPDKACYSINYVVMRSNLSELREAADFWEAHEFHTLAFIIMVTRSLRLDLLLESPEPIIEEVCDALEQTAGHIIRNNYKLVVISPAFRGDFAQKRMYPEKFHEERLQNFPKADWPPRSISQFQRGQWPGMPVECLSPFVFARILPTGDVQLCHQFIIGNIYDANLKDIWLGESASRVRQQVMSGTKTCMGCDYFRFCIHSSDIDLTNRYNFYNATTLAQLNGGALPTFIARSSSHAFLKWKELYYAIPNNSIHLGMQFLEDTHSQDVLRADSLDALISQARDSEVILEECRRLEVLMSSVDHSAAVREAKQAVVRHPQSHHIWRLLGRTLRLSGNLIDALSALERSLSIAKTPSALFEIASLARALGATDLAIRTEQILLREFPDWSPDAD